MKVRLHPSEIDAISETWHARRDSQAFAYELSHRVCGHRFTVSHEDMSRSSLTRTQPGE